MTEKKRVLAIIPARGGSKGLPGKNTLPLCGKPLIAWSIEQALACPEVDTVIVSTDSQSIADISKSYGAEVPFLRPKQLSSDSASSIDVVIHAIDYMKEHGLEYELVTLLEPTSPLRESSDISGAINCLFKTQDVESIVGVSLVEAVHPSYLYRKEEGFLRAYLGEYPKSDLRRQDLDTLYFLEGSVYVSRINSMYAKRSFYHEATAPWVVPRYKSFEVDEAADLIIIEAVITARQEGRIY